MAQKHPDWAVFWGSVNPLEGKKALDEMEIQVKEFGAKAFKFYNVRYDYGQPFPWRMDDPRVAFPVFEKAQELGVNLIGVHKGVPLGPQPIEHTRTFDMDGAAANFPDINFVIFHVGLPWLDEVLWQIVRFPNLYASIAATVKMMWWCGEDKIIYGGEAPIWHPQWALEAFWDFELPEDIVTERGYPQLTDQAMGSLTPEDIVDRAPALLPATAREVARGLGADDEEAIANAVRTYLPVYQLPPRGILGQGGVAKLGLFEDEDREGTLDTLVERYLKAFGPATVMDFQKWSGLTRTKPAFARFEQVDGVHYDVPDGPRPDPETPAPPRFLGEYDNVLLGHADRSRVIAPGFPWGGMLAHGRYVNNLLVDGMLRATWWLEDDVLAIRPFGELDHAPVEAEAEAFPWARDVRWEPALPSAE